MKKNKPFIQIDLKWSKRINIITAVLLFISGTLFYINSTKIPEGMFKDPKTGKPITHKTKSVTVIHDNSMKADGWATAFLALGRVDGLKIAEKEKIAVLFIDKIDDKLIKFKSNQFVNFKQN